MDKINYLSNSTVNQTGKYPVTIQGLNFIQNQILALQNIALAGGKNYILKPSTQTSPGIVVLDGEILPLIGLPRNSTYKYLKIVENTETDIITDNGTYRGLRTVREVRYSTNSSDFPISELETFKTNAALAKALAEINQKPDNEFLPMYIGVYSDEELKTKKTPMRIFCRQGSHEIFGYKTYTLDVYDCGNNTVYQELKGTDLRRFGRYYNPATGKWSNFVPVDEQLTLEGKVIKKVFYLRHGFLPPYAKIIVLRKKRRTKNAGIGRPDRSPKVAYYHGWQMELTQGTPNQWYIPKCSFPEKSKLKDMTGTEFYVAMNHLLFLSRKTGTMAWRIAGVRKKWKTTSTAYAKLGLAVITSDTHNVPAQQMLRLKYRVSSKRVGTVWSNIIKTLSVD